LILNKLHCIIILAYNLIFYLRHCTLLYKPGLIGTRTSRVTSSITPLSLKHLVYYSVVIVKSFMTNFTEAYVEA